MNKIICPKGQWVEIASNITAYSFSLICDESLNAISYKIHTGTAVPPIDTDVFISINVSVYNSGTSGQSIVFNNSTAQNIYVMSSTADGSAIIF